MDVGNAGPWQADGAALVPTGNGNELVHLHQALSFPGLAELILAIFPMGNPLLRESIGFLFLVHLPLLKVGFRISLNPSF
jgi:hypothetical protein